MRTYTTAEAAKICKVAPRTIKKWFDSGRLEGQWTTGPDDKERRIPKDKLIKFLKEHGMPLGELAGEVVVKVLLVAQDQAMIEELEREMSPEKLFEIEVVAGGFNAGLKSAVFCQDCMIVDFSIGKVEALQICQNLRKNLDFTATILIALLPDDGCPMSFDRSAINETFKKPVEARLLAKRLRKLIGARKELV